MYPVYSYILHATGLMQICLTHLPPLWICSVPARGVSLIFISKPGCGVGAAGCTCVYWVVYEFRACSCAGIERSLVPVVAALPSGYV